MDMNQIVGKRVSDFLEDKGWTQVKLANKMGVSRQIMNNIIQGKKNITVAEVKSIAEVLQVDVEDLTKTFTKGKEPETITAFMGEVSTDKAKNGIKKVEKIMDMIVFHKQTNDSFEDMMS